MKSIQDYVARNNEINDILGGMQNRELTDAEQSNYDMLVREFEANKRQIEMQNIARENKPVEKAESLREVLASAKRQSREISFAELTSEATNNITASGAQVKNIMEMLPVLEKGLIWNRLGLRVQTGVKGSVLWPYATNAVEVEEKTEAAALNDTDINFANKQAVPYASGITIKVTNEAIDEAAFDVEGFVQTQAGLAVLRYLNKKTFSTANWSGLAGPFKNASPADMDGTYANIKAKKAAIAATGVDMTYFAYVCDNKTKALLESTPKANGQGGMICENGMIDGDPVYVTEYINTKANGEQETGKYYLEMGCWNYLAANQHGDLRVTVDGISLASTGEEKITLFTRWSLTNLAPDAAWVIVNLVPASPVTAVKLVSEES